MQNGFQKIEITKEGLGALVKEYELLANDKRPKLVDRLENARQQGDLSENHDYKTAREELEFLDGRIEELKYVIDNAQVAKKNGKTGVVAIGTTVTVKTNGHKNVFELVGHWEANPANKKISHSSPLGMALMGKKVGKKVEVEAPAGKIIYQIIAVE
ncbi:transcription elongation factor GreA [Candidatus Woesebacteria bacterium]|nr:transcription elongation factor GreA [Candidatus Woesebacteria bacterium]